MNKANTQAARALGAIAFAKGISAPALDGALTAMFAGRLIGDVRTLAEMKAWIAGNTQSRLSA